MFRIIIEEIKREKYTKKEYQKVADTGNERDGRGVYEYVSTEDERDVITKVLEQVRDDIDLPEIIKAVNELD